jgi:hypothetical protein
MASGSTAMLMDSSPREEAYSHQLRKALTLRQDIAGARMRCDLPLSAAPPYNISVAVEKNATPCFG